MPSPLRNITPVLADGMFYMLEYNGYLFDPAATETLGVSARPKHDEANRTVTHVEFDLTVKTVIYVSDDDFPYSGDAVTTDFVMSGIIQRLTAQGGDLVYQGKGFGDFNINTGIQGAGFENTGQWDVAWGPTPTLVECKPIADNRAWEIIWSVKVCIPSCSNARYQDALMAFNYTVDYSTDYGGYTTRTIRGYIEVPMTRDNQGDRQLRHASADRFREQILVQMPSGFRDAGGGSYTLSADRRRLDFQFVHIQLPGIVPPLGVLKCSLKMRTQNEKRGNFLSWFYTIDASYEMAYGKVQAVAARHFRRVVVDYIIKLNHVTQGQKKSKANNGAGSLPFIEDDTLANIEFGANINGGIAGWIAGDVAGRYRRWQKEDLTVPTPPVGPAADDNGGTVTSNVPGIVGSIVNNLPVPPTTTTNVNVTDDFIQNALLPQTNFVMPIFYSAEDPDAYDKPRANFSCTLYLAGTLPQFLNAGLWEPIIDTPTHKEWKASLGKIWDSRGIADMGFSNSDDLIIDLCRTPSAFVIGTPLGNNTLQSVPGAEPPTATIIGTPVGTIVGSPVGSNPGNTTPQSQQPSPYQSQSSGSLRNNQNQKWFGEFKREFFNSTGQEWESYIGDDLWMEFKNNITYMQIEDQFAVKKLPTDFALDNQYVPINNKIVDDRWIQNAGNMFNVQHGGTTIESPTRYGARVAPDYIVQIEGFAIKAGEPADAPELVSIAGVPAVPNKRIVKVETVGNVFYPVYKTSWVKTYFLPRHQGKIIEPGTLDSQGTSSLTSMGGGTSSLKNVGA